MKYHQKNLTISDKQAKTLIDESANHSIRELAKMIGEPTQKTYNNMRLLGLVNHRNINFELDETIFFNPDKFFEKYECGFVNISG